MWELYNSFLLLCNALYYMIMQLCVVRVISHLAPPVILSKNNYMNLKKLLATFAFALVILLTGCAKDDVVEIVGVCPIVLSTVPDDGAINVPLDQAVSYTHLRAHET